MLPAHRELARQLGFRAWLGVPVMLGDRVLGVLSARTRRPAGFSAEDVEIATAFAGQAAIALENSRLYGELDSAVKAIEASQERLVQAERLRALGEMAAGVAHDFNNLLAVILGRTELMLPAMSDPTLVRNLATIRQAALDGAQTVRRIQEFTRTRRTRPFGRVDVAASSHDVVDLTRPRWEGEAQSRGLHYEVGVERRAAAAGRGPPRGAARGLHEPRGERAGGDADRRAVHLPRLPGGRLGRRRGRGHRPRHVGGGAPPGVRAVLHDQGRSRHRARSRGRVGHRDATRRDHRGRERGRSRHALRGPPAGRHDRRGVRGRRGRAARAAAPLGPSAPHRGRAAGARRHARDARSRRVRGRGGGGRGRGPGGLSDRAGGAGADRRVDAGDVRLGCRGRGSPSDSRASRSGSSPAGETASIPTSWPDTASASCWPSPSTSGVSSARSPPPWNPRTPRRPSSGTVTAPPSVATTL